LKLGGKQTFAFMDAVKQSWGKEALRVKISTVGTPEP
jgi:hypothetical protein